MKSLAQLTRPSMLMAFRSLQGVELIRSIEKQRKKAVKMEVTQISRHDSFFSREDHRSIQRKRWLAPNK